MKLFVVLAFLLASLTCSAQKTGLKFASPEQLMGIPLASTPYSGEALPPVADLSLRMPPAGNQGNQNSCVGWAVAYGGKSYQEKLEENNNYMNGAALNTQAVFSPAFIYNQINNGQDGGSLFTDALNVVSQQGAVKWADMPYTDQDYLRRPNQQQTAKAKKYKIDFWRRVNIADIKEVKAQLNAGYPVVIGASLDQGVQAGGKNAALTGRDYIWSSVTGQEIGGHAMVVVGYSDAKNAFKILNSWGENWGTKGYFWISYTMFPKVVREGYVMKDAVNGTENNPTKPDPVVVNPTSDIKANFLISNVQHNVQDPNLGLSMRFIGMADLPAGAGKTVQIVIRFYFNDGRNGKGMPVRSLSQYFMMPDGTAVCGTPKSPFQSGNQPWYATMPYMYLDVPKGGVYQPRTSYLLAEPTLYIDGFAVKTGQLIPFFVNL